MIGHKILALAQAPDHGEMTTAEINHLLDEMADAGVFILTFSGGEIFLRKDFFELP